MYNIDYQKAIDSAGFDKFLTVNMYMCGKG